MNSQTFLFQVICKWAELKKSGIVEYLSNITFFKVMWIWSNLWNCILVRNLRWPLKPSYFRLSVNGRSYGLVSDWSGMEDDLSYQARLQGSKKGFFTENLKTFWTKYLHTNLSKTFFTFSYIQYNQNYFNFTHNNNCP